MFEVMGFLLGVHITMTLFGSLYRIIDLYFCIKEFWLEVTARIALNLSAVFLIYMLTSGGFLTGFMIGQAFFTVFHVAIFWFGQFVLYLLRR